VQNDVTGRMAFAYTFMTVAHQIYLMTAMMNSIAHLKQTNAAAGMVSTKNVLSSPCTHVIKFGQFGVYAV